MVSRALRYALLLLVKNAAAQQECGGFVLLGFDLHDFSRYGEYFRNDSKMTLLQAGSYYGADGIEEYMRFAFASPFLDEDSIDQKYGPKAYDGVTCTFYRAATARLTFKAPAVAGASLDVGSYSNIVYDIAGNYVKYVQIGFQKPYLETFFGTMTNTNEMRASICETMQSYCPATWEKQAVQSKEACTARIAALPIAEGALAAVDGKSQGCRVLHGVFAATNAFHCPHISYEPEADGKGDVKCQVSDPDLDARLNDADQAAFDSYLASRNIPVDKGFVLHPTLPCAANSDCPVGLICDLSTPPASHVPVVEGTTFDDAMRELGSEIRVVMFPPSSPPTPGRRSVLFGSHHPSGSCALP